jgi:ribosomal-protein-alanine N-acetyltransferase
MSLTLRYMRLADVPEVAAIDRVSFDPPWSPRSYEYEITESTYSHMVVLERQAGERPSSNWRKLINNFGIIPDPGAVVVGYGGVWNIVDEAHISTIAVHPMYRGHGYGEIVLAGMIRRALTLKAGYIVLEVRVSNVVAQNLYRKYGFEVIGTKPNYYHSNNEDAYDMRLQLHDLAAYRARFEPRFHDLQVKRDFIDLYTDVRHPQG